MPRVHTQKAAKDYPNIGIKKGDTYYKWKFRYGPQIRSKTYPRQSQLTQSPHLSALYSASEAVEDCADPTDSEELMAALQSAMDFAQEAVDGYEEAASACEGGIGEAHQERADAAQEVQSEYEDLHGRVEEAADSLADGSMDKDEYEGILEEIYLEATGVEYYDPC